MATTTISPERLAELRAMPYEEYIDTLEWLETQKKIVKRDNYQCQGCHAFDVLLVVHHYTTERQGCEDENDVVTLCERCHDNLLRLMNDPPKLTFLQRCSVGLGTAALGTIGMEGFLHAPLPAELAVLIGAIFLAQKSPAVYDLLKRKIPADLLAWLGQAPEKGKPSVLDVWFGRTPRVVDTPAPQDVDRDQESQRPNTNEPAPSTEPVFPVYPPDVTLRLGQAIDKQALARLVAANQARKPLPQVAGRRFEPHINSIYGLGIILAAAQGSGKSMLNGLLIEQSGACDSPVIMFDHKGEYVPITELNYLNGLIAGGASAMRKAEKTGAPYFALTRDNAKEFVAMVFADHCQAIVMLPSYGDSWLAKAEIVAAVGQSLMQYSTKQREEEKLILPCLVFLDEAQLYIPENVNLLPPEAKENRAILNNLSNAFFSLVSNGRSYGYTMCFATQSLTYIAKWAIKSCQLKVLMRHVEHNDLNTCEEILGPKAIVKRDDLETMPPGVGVVFNLTPKPMIVQFDKRESRDESETPGVERLRQARQGQTAVPSAKNTTKVGDLSLDELIALLSRAKQDTPDTETVPDYAGSNLALGQEVSISREMFDVAIRLRKSGMSTGFRDLMTTFDLSEHYARRLNKRIDDEIAREMSGS